MAVIVDNIIGETIVISRTVVQQSCSYKALITDTTTITPSQYDRGKVEYFILSSTGAYNKIGEVSKGSSFYYDFCSPGIYTIKQLLTIREIPNCGGVSPIIYQEDLIANSTILEYIPDVNLPGVEDCLIVGNVQTLSFVFSLNNNVCPVSPSANTLSVSVVETPALSTVTGFSVTSPTTPYNWAVTFDKIGTYLFNVTIQNCCTTTVKQLTVNVCAPFQIIPDCCTCGKYTINNFSLNTSVPYSIVQLYPENNSTEDVSSTVLPGQSQQIVIDVDGIYEIRYTDIDNIEKVKLWYVFCRLNDCMNGLIKNILCTEGCKECPGKQQEKDREKLNKIMLLSQLYYKWIDEEMQGKSYNLFPENKLLDYDNRIKELYQIDDVYNKIIEICDNCISKGTTNSDCGCNCK